MYLVKLWPYANSPRVSQIYAGLYDLHAIGKIRLKLTFQLSKMPVQRLDDLLWLEVFDVEKKMKRLCFDLRDAGAVIDEEDLPLADAYFKRSYDHELVSRFSPELSRKILPFGLNYACRSRREHGFSRLFFHNVLLGNFSKKPLWACKNVFGYPLKQMCYRLNLLPADAAAQFVAEDFEVDPVAPSEDRIFFQTHCWSTKEAPNSGPEKLREVNRLRIGVIRLLKKAFGKRFVGGIVPSPYAEQECPDCILPYTGDKKYCLSMMQKSLIAVTTSGLHNSIGWKLGEYVAASRCIVTETLRYGIPVPLEENKNILSFESPEECVNACRRILDDPDFAAKMQKSNAEYYAREVKPSSLVYRCLDTAFNGK